jgi:large subunit ribosomal protein L25
MPIILKAKKREELNKKVNELREKGFIPAVLYGNNIENKNLTLTANEFVKVYQEAGTSTLIDLEVGEKQPVKVIIADIQRDPVKHTIMHADFHQINMQEEITTEVALDFIGESPAVKKAGGVLLKNMEAVEVKCLPGDLPHSFIVNLEKLDVIDSHFAVKDLEVSDKVKILVDPEELIAIVKAMKVEEEEEPVSEEEAGEKTEDEGGEKEAAEKEGEDDKKGNNKKE